MNINNEEIDIKENSIFKLSINVLSILLQDHSSNKNIIFATDTYAEKGYKFHDEITIDKITGYNGQIIKPRIKKSKIEQEKRIKEKAEVFTPSWICNSQNNLVDNAWFNKENIFNVENGMSWKTKKGKILFPTDSNKTWYDYVNSVRMEVSCGEAPYLVSRYDTTTGDILNVDNRIGMLDRKIRVINENVNEEKEWYSWVIKAYKSIFGYEWQGDSLLIARENILYSFIDYYNFKFKKNPNKDQLMEIATIISWNIFQMDGIKYVIPNSCHLEKQVFQLNLFDDEKSIEEECIGCKKGNNKLHNGIYCRIMNWNTNRKIKFISLLK
jgi:hypothetical protein